jgi:hypothetical protein
MPTARASGLLRLGLHRLGDPGRGLARRRNQGVAEDAGRAREHEPLHLRGNRFLEKVQGAENIRHDEILARVRDDVRLVKCCRVNDGIGTVEERAHQRAVGDRADARRHGPAARIDAFYVRAETTQRSHHAFAEVPRAAGNDDTHFARSTLAARA